MSLNTHYYSFGSPINGRSVNAGNTYAYGFNGKRNDLETSTQDYGMRIYNPSLGRFLSVDPIANDYPWNSTYAFAENDVISCIDLDGLEKYKIIKDFIYYNDDVNRDNNKAVVYPNGTIKDKFDDKDEEVAAKALDYFTSLPKSNTVGVQIIKTTATDVEDKAIEKESHKKVDTDKKMKDIAKKSGVPPKLDIVFESAKAKIIDEGNAKTQLKKLANFLKNNPKASVVIKGNTIAADDSPITGGGKDALNQKVTPGQPTTLGQLMKARADAVKAILVKIFGINPTRIQTGTGVNNKTKDVSTEVK